MNLEEELVNEFGDECNRSWKDINSRYIYINYKLNKLYNIIYHY